MNEERGRFLVRRLVEDVMVAGRLDLLDELFVPERSHVMRERIVPFRTSFPDLRMEIVTIVAEGEYIAGHFRCSGTHLGSWRGSWRGHPPTGHRFGGIEEMYFFETAGDRLAMMWSVEDTTERMRQFGLS